MPLALSADSASGSEDLEVGLVPVPVDRGVGHVVSSCRALLVRGEFPGEKGGRLQRPGALRVDDDIEVIQDHGRLDRSAA